MSDFYSSCNQCPRKCGANRNGGQVGFCREPSDLRIAFAGLHYGEEPLITVFGGSGTIFFTGCTLRCAFCQNYQISQDGYGRAVSTQEFAEICLKLQNAGAENINLVTGSHNIPAIAKGLRAARDKGVTIPFCWNSSAYESVKMLELLRGLVTIWLPDLKTLDPTISKNLFAAPDYPEVAKRAITWMIQNNPLRIEERPCPPDAKPVEWAEQGAPRDKMLQGVIIRHLYLPGQFEATADVLAWLKENADGRAISSIMNQYTPVPFKETPALNQSQTDATALQTSKPLFPADATALQASNTLSLDTQNKALQASNTLSLAARNKALQTFENRLVSDQEFEDIQDLLEAFDFEYLFYQELTDDTSWLPDFTREQPFSNKLARPLWHC